MKFAENPKLLLASLLSLMIVYAFFSSTIALAQSTNTVKSVDQVLQDIMSSQNAANVNQVDCNKVSNLQFEELGDAVMERMMGNHQLHERMDVMMGGDGSQSLTQMHINMGSNWLGCTASFQGGFGPGMMGGGFGGMMGRGFFSGYMGNMMMNMMGYYYPAYYISYNQLFTLTIVGWVLFIAMLAVSILLWTGRITIPKKKR